MFNTKKCSSHAGEKLLKLSIRYYILESIISALSPANLDYFVLLPPGAKVQVQSRLFQDLKGFTQALQPSSGFDSSTAGCCSHFCWCCFGLERLLHHPQWIQTQAVQLLSISIPQQLLHLPPQFLISTHQAGALSHYLLLQTVIISGH